MQNVLIEAHSGALKLTATDLETAGVTTVQGKGTDRWKITAPAALLLKYLKALDGTVTIQPKTNHWITVSQGTDEAEIAGMGFESYPELPTLTTCGTLSGLVKAIPRASFAISSEESRFSLNGALLEANGKARLVSTDGHRLSLVPLGYDGTPLRALVPRRALTEIARLNADSVAVGANDDHLIFQHGDRSIISRKLTGNFPDYERVLPKEYTGFCALPVKETLKILGRVDVFCDERSHATKWQIDGGTLTIHASVCETGNAKGSVALTACQGGPVEIGLNGHYCQDVLKLIDGPAGFCWRDASSSVGFITGDGWQTVVMPMRT